MLIRWRQLRIRWHVQVMHLAHAFYVLIQRSFQTYCRIPQDSTWSYYKMVHTTHITAVYHSIVEHSSSPSQAAYLAVQHAIQQQVGCGGNVLQVSNAAIETVGPGRIILDHILGGAGHQLRLHICWRSSLQPQ